MKNLLRRPLAPAVRNGLDFLLDSQYWPQEKILAYQWHKLKKLLQHAYRNIPYYRQAFTAAGATPEDIQTAADFSRLPVLSKKDIQQSFEHLLPPGLDRTGLSLNATGGSTGTPLNFYQDSTYELWADAARLRAWRYIPGGGLKDLEAVFWGAVQDIGKGFSPRQMLRAVLREGILPLNTFDLDARTLKRYLRWYNRLRPPLLRGYATSLYYVAGFLDQHALPVHPPRAIVSSTEVLHAKMRRKIEAVFQAPVFDSYGCREVSQIATECHCHCGLHVVFENQYVEVVDQQIIVTNLHNYAMPFIRYAVGDLARELTWESCPCGRHSPRLLDLLGRDNDNIELPDGKVINGEFFEFLFFGMDEVVQYQITFSRSTQQMHVRLQLKEGSDPAAVAGLIRRAMAEKFAFDRIDISQTDVFQKTPTGKLRFVYMID